MTALSDEFLNISKLQPGKIYLNLQSFDISELIKEMVEEFALTSAKHKIILKVCSSLIVKAAPVKIGQVLAILSNAIKYFLKSKIIEISCEQINQLLQVSIRDEDMRIKQNDLEKLFDRYQRIKSIYTQAIAGFGLGLYLSGEIIQRHNGKAWVESELGKGSIYFNLH